MYGKEGHDFAGDPGQMLEHPCQKLKAEILICIMVFWVFLVGLFPGDPLRFYLYPISLARHDIHFLLPLEALEHLESFPLSFPNSFEDA